jgi:hypothetical protein
MLNLVLECNDFLKNNGFNYAFCGGHAIDINLGYITRPHGDIDLSAYWEERNFIINFMQTQRWIVYEAMGNGKVHLITNIANQKMLKVNIFCVKDGCTFFHTEHIENDIYKCEIDHIEQRELDYMEFLFNKHTENKFIYSRNNEIQRDLDKALLQKNNIAYLSPELVLLYKSTDIQRKENRQDFNTVILNMSKESKKWLQNSLKIAYPDGHEWISSLNS